MKKTLYTAGCPTPVSEINNVLIRETSLSPKIKLTVGESIKIEATTSSILSVRTIPFSIFFYSSYISSSSFLLSLSHFYSPKSLFGSRAGRHAGKACCRIDKGSPLQPPFPGPTLPVSQTGLHRGSGESRTTFSISTNRKGGGREGGT